ITANSGNYQTSAYGNYRIGGLAANKASGVGDLKVGNTGTNGTAGYGDDMLYASCSDASTSAISAGAYSAGDFLLTTASGSYDVLYNSGSSAADVASAINRLNTGVTASAINQVVLGGSTASGEALSQNSTYTFQIANDFTNGSDPASFTTVS